MKRCLWSVSAVALTCLGICAVAAAQESRPAAAPRLELGAREWNFGEVWQGEPLSFEFQVKNAGDAPLEISDVKSSCGCTVPTKPKSPLAPGESDTVKISFDSVKRHGAQSQTVTFATNDPQQPMTSFKLSGTIKPVYDITPANSISFGKLYQDSQESRSVEIIDRYTDKMPLKLKEGQDFGSYTVELKEIKPDEHYQLTATPKLPLAVGEARGRVVLLTGIERLPEIEVLIFGAVQPPVAVSRSSLLLPKNSVRAIEQVLYVSYPPNHPVRILEAKATIESIKVEIREAKANESKPEQSAQEIVVVLPPGNQVPDGAEPSIEITTDCKDAAYQKLVVPIRIVFPRSSDKP